MFGQSLGMALIKKRKCIFKVRELKRNHKKKSFYRKKMLTFEQSTNQ